MFGMVYLSEMLDDFVFVVLDGLFDCFVVFKLDVIIIEVLFVEECDFVEWLLVCYGSDYCVFWEVVVCVMGLDLLVVIVVVDKILFVWFG